MSGLEPGSGRTGREGRTRPFLRWALGLKTALDWSGRIVSGLCLAFLFSALLVNVILRYAFGSGLAWAYEIHALLLPWLVAGGIVIAAAKGRNIAITLLPEMLGPVKRRALMLGVETLTLVISVGVLSSCPPILRAANFQTYSTIQITQIWGYASLVYAFAGLTLIAGIDIIRILAGQDVIDLDPGHASLS